LVFVCVSCKKELYEDLRIIIRNRTDADHITITLYPIKRLKQIVQNILNVKIACIIQGVRNIPCFPTMRLTGFMEILPERYIIRPI